MSRKKEKIKIKIKTDYSSKPNKLHLEVQKNNRMIIFKDKTKYTRKTKYKNKDLDK